MALTLPDGSDALTLTGFESGAGEAGKKRMLTGSLMTDAASADGSAGLVLSVSGKHDKHGFFQVRKAKGRFVRSSANAVFVGSAKLGKRLK